MKASCRRNAGKGWLCHCRVSSVQPHRAGIATPWGKTRVGSQNTQIVGSPLERALHIQKTRCVKGSQKQKHKVLGLTHPCTDPGIRSAPTAPAPLPAPLPLGNPSAFTFCLLPFTRGAVCGAEPGAGADSGPAFRFRFPRGRKAAGSAPRPPCGSSRETREEDVGINLLLPPLDCSGGEINH